MTSSSVEPSPTPAEGGDQERTPVEVPGELIDPATLHALRGFALALKLQGEYTLTLVPKPAADAGG